MASRAELSSWWNRVIAWSGTPDDEEGGFDSVDRLIKSYADGVFVMAKGAVISAGDGFDQIAGAAGALAAQASPDASEVFALEARLIRQLPVEERRRLHWVYRERFQRMASPAELAAYLAATSMPSAGGEPPEPDTLSLLNAMHRNYLNTVVREGALRDLKRWVQLSMIRAAVAFAALIAFLELGRVYWGFSAPLVAFGAGLLLLFFLGRLGASMSVIQRLQRAADQADKDPFFEITALCTGRRGISMALLSGSVFALLLYVVFGAGLGANLGMSGGIFPEVGRNSAAEVESRNATEEPAAEGGAAAGVAAGQQPPPQPRPETASNPRADRTDRQTLCDKQVSDCMPEWVIEIGKHLGFRSYPDFFKMLLLAFLAGFAERLVPDAIDRLTRRQESTVESQTRRGASSTTTRTDHAG